MEDFVETQDAQWLGFSRANIADVLDVPPARLNNWLDRNKLWQTQRGTKFHRAYTLREVFDVGGFAAMRLAKIPESHCARYVYNFGFMRSFWDIQQEVNFDFRADGWSLGSYDPDALLTIKINVRALGEKIFLRISELSKANPDNWPRGAFSSFQALYFKAVELERLRPNCVPLFESGIE